MENFDKKKTFQMQFFLGVRLRSDGLCRHRSGRGHARVHSAQEEEKEEAQPVAQPLQKDSVQRLFDLSGMP